MQIHNMKPFYGAIFVFLGLALPLMSAGEAIWSPGSGDQPAALTKSELLRFKKVTPAVSSAGSSPARLSGVSVTTPPQWAGARSSRSAVQEQPPAKIPALALRRRVRSETNVKVLVIPIEARKTGAGLQVFTVSAVAPPPAK